MNRVWKQGQTILFQGDSITDCDRNRKDTRCLGHGYPRKIAQIYDILYPGHGLKFINRGISGNRVCDLLGRYEEDFLQIAPDFISILVVRNT